MLGLSQSACQSRNQWASRFVPGRAPALYQRSAPEYKTTKTRISLMHAGALLRKELGAVERIYPAV